jgi:hypothetical protein
MKRLLLIFIVVAFFILHQDFWYWRETAPIVFGFLPIGLFYHVCYTIAVSLLMLLLVKYAWPSHLEESHSSNPQSAPLFRRPAGHDLQSEDRE